MLTIILGAGAVYAIASFPAQVTVNVKEPLAVSPSTFSINGWAGGSTTYTVSACNSANFAIPITFQALVTAYPPNGSTNDITLKVTQADGSSPLPAQIAVPQADASGAPTCYIIDILVSIDPGAQFGPYTISNTATKVF